MEKTRRITAKTHTPLTQPCPYQIHSASDGQPDLKTGAAEGLQASTVSGVPGFSAGRILRVLLEPLEQTP